MAISKKVYSARIKITEAELVSDVKVCRKVQYIKPIEHENKPSIKSYVFDVSYRLPQNTPIIAKEAQNRERSKSV